MLNYLTGHYFATFVFYFLYFACYYFQIMQNYTGDIEIFIFITFILSTCFNQ